MPRSEGQKLKLIRLLTLLIEHTDETHGLTMPEIVSALGEYGITAERKSLYDDLLALEELGFTVEKTSTRPPRYYLAERIFELAELKLLVDAIQSSKFITEERSRLLIDKLKRFAGKYGSQELSRTVYVEGRAKTMNRAVLYSIDEIHRAINLEREISFKYFSYNYKKERVLHRGGAVYNVSPLALIWREENYYLVAYDGQTDTIRNFRVDKMCEVTLTDRDRLIPEGQRRLNSADYSRKIFGMYRGEETAVTLECTHNMANIFIDRFGQDVPLIPCEGGFRASVNVMVSPQFYGWLMGLGTDVRIKSPEWVRRGYLDELKKIVDCYGEEE